MPSLAPTLLRPWSACQRWCLAQSGGAPHARHGCGKVGLCCLRAPVRTARGPYGTVLSLPTRGGGALGTGAKVLCAPCVRALDGWRSDHRPGGSAAPGCAWGPTADELQRLPPAGAGRLGRRCVRGSPGRGGTRAVRGPMGGRRPDMAQSGPGQSLRSRSRSLPPALGPSRCTAASRGAQGRRDEGRPCAAVGTVLRPARCPKTHAAPMSSPDGRLRGLSHSVAWSGGSQRARSGTASAALPRPTLASTPGRCTRTDGPSPMHQV